MIKEDLKQILDKGGNRVYAVGITMSNNSNWNGDILQKSNIFICINNKLLKLFFSSELGGWIGSCFESNSQWEE